MPVERLAEMLDRFQKNDPGRGRGALMRDLLPVLDRVVVERVVWPLRSLNGLVLLASDDWRTPWHVVVEVDTPPFPNISALASAPTAGSLPAYEVWVNRGRDRARELRLDRGRANDFDTFGVARTPNDAATLSLEAMIRSGGWT
jgi:hypothetical protein